MLVGVLVAVLVGVLVGVWVAVFVGVWVGVGLAVGGGTDGTGVTCCHISVGVGETCGSLQFCKTSHGLGKNPQPENAQASNPKTIKATPRINKS